MPLLRKLLENLAWHLKTWAKKISPTPEEILCRKWFADRGDQTHRLNYPLTEQSVVFDLGGHIGDWAGEIFCRYNCPVFIFEPVSQYAATLLQRFQHNPKIKIFPLGLSNQDGELQINLDKDRSSLFQNHSSQKESITLQKASDFLSTQGITSIDLMKINIEGGEYDLLENLIESGWIKKIKNVQVQFHAFVPNAEARMRKLQEILSKTHILTYQYPWVWENWTRQQH